MNRAPDLPQLFLGDLLQAFHDLQPKDDTTRAAMVEMLQLAPPEPQETTRIAPDAKRSLPRETPPAIAEVPVAEVLPEDEADLEEERDLAQAEATETARAGAETVRDALPWARRRRLLPMRVETVPAARRPFVAPTVPAATDEEHESPPDLLPLLHPSWTRAVLTAAAAGQVAQRAIDVDAVVAELARLRMSATLPRLRTWSLSRGVQVLADDGEGMVPFARDVDSLIAAVVELAGPELTEILHFAGGPWHGVLDAASWSELPYIPPAPGVPILLISDFGIARRPFSSEAATSIEWRRFLEELRGDGHEVIAFVPYPRERWPRMLVDSAQLVQWDRGTTVMQVRSARAGRRSR
jgi:hypothetical protein